MHGICLSIVTKSFQRTHSQDLLLHFVAELEKDKLVNKLNVIEKCRSQTIDRLRYLTRGEYRVGGSSQVHAQVPVRSSVDTPSVASASTSLSMDEERIRFWDVNFTSGVDEFYHSFTNHLINEGRILNSLAQKRLGNAFAKTMAKIAFEVCKLHWKMRMFRPDIHPSIHHSKL